MAWAATTRRDDPAGIAGGRGRGRPEEISVTPENGLSNRIRDGVLHFDFVGDLTLDLVAEVYARVATDPDFRPGMPTVNDLRRHTSVLDFARLRAVREYVARLHAGATGPRRIAYISDDPLLNVMLRFLRVVVELVPVEDRVSLRGFTTKSYDQALAWLQGHDER